MSKILVFGHRNPDTDAIGAAIGLAHLEAALGSDVEAVALGRPSLETAFALDHFGLDAPRVIETAAPAEVMLVDHNERQQSVADNGDIVAAMIDGEATVKTFKRTKGQVWLMPHNELFEPIPGDDAAVLGKVVTVMRRI